MAKCRLGDEKYCFGQPRGRLWLQCVRCVQQFSSHGCELTNCIGSQRSWRLERRWRICRGRVCDCNRRLEPGKCERREKEKAKRRHLERFCDIAFATRTKLNATPPTQAMGSHTTAHGYASNSLGEGTTSSTWGETALGLFTEASDLSEEEQRNASVIPVVSSCERRRA